MSYRKFYDFGSSMNNNVNNVNNPSNPLTYCLFDTKSVQFNHGSTAATYDPMCNECQSYMALRCAGKYNDSETWDQYCEVYYKSNTDTYWPNRAAIERIPACITNMCGKITLGQSMLRNAAERRFLEFPLCAKKYTQFDPNVANSPLIEQVNGCECNYTSIKLNLGNIAALNSDRLMNKCLDNFQAVADILAIIYKGVQVLNVNLNGTRLGQHFAQYGKFYDSIAKAISLGNPYYQYAGYTAPVVQQAVNDCSMSGCAGNGCQTRC
jgi:hypothetical protein